MLRSPNRSSGFGRSSRPEMVTGNSLSLTDVLDPGCAKTSRGQRPIQDIGTEGNTGLGNSFALRPCTLRLKPFRSPHQFLAYEENPVARLVRYIRRLPQP